MADYIWDLRNPDGGAMGLDFARGRSAPFDVMLAHALPERVNVEVRTDTGDLVARGRRLKAEGSTPMSRLTLHEGVLSRENIWPGEEDIGRPVILPGGEIGILQSWWNAEDHSEWRWVIELHNSRRPRRERATEQP
jgi:hypothetical protein